MAERPKRSRATFRERDVKAAIRAAEAVGKTVASARITQDGAIEVTFLAGEIPAKRANPWDDEG